MRIHKTFILLLITLLFIQCDTFNKVTGSNRKSSSTKRSGTTTASTRSSASDYNIQYRDDFLAVSDKERADILKEMDATEEKYSLLVFTKNFKGEKIIVTGDDNKRLFSNYVISDVKRGYADKMRIDNTTDTKIFDNLTKKEIIIEAKKAQKYKFVYVQKDNANKKSPFLITYSNTLRPLD